MWKDNDIKDLFRDFEVQPPIENWSKIALKISKKKYYIPIPESTFFNTAQKYTLIAAVLSSILLCSFMMRFIESKQEMSLSNSTKKETVEASQSARISIPNIALNQNISLARNQSARRHSIVSKKSIPVLEIKKEYQSLAEEVKELYLLDQEIQKLDQEIATLQNNLTTVQQSSKYSEIESKKPNLLAFNSNRLYKLSPNPAKYSLSENTKVPKWTIINLDSSLEKYAKFYVTPTIGSNFTQVFYQSTPNNEFFSENAQFRGKFGYNAGVQFGYQLSPRWSIESGIGIGQYIQSFSETHQSFDRNGIMYIDQLDIPLLARYSFPLSSRKFANTLSIKSGLIYSNVIFYQVNYTDKDVSSLQEKNYNLDVDKRKYNSLQLGYATGLDLDLNITKKLSLNLSMLNALVSQIENFPLFNGDKHRPIQFSTSFSIGTKLRF